MIDTAQIIIQAGKGGDGAATFRHEKYVPRGGPDGGDGGDGGDVLCVATREINTLGDFHRLKHYKAQDGQRGGKQKKHGANAPDLTIRVPIGTIIKDKNDKIVADLIRDNQQITLAKGGKGGRGNCRFTTATHQTPREFEAGREGEEGAFGLELKLLADVGLVGLPNSGKSTLLSVITRAKPKIASYPFSTTEPMLGVVHHKRINFVVADIPGLIEGAAAGKGLGDQFLKHIERTRVIVHLVSAESHDPAVDYKNIRHELESFSRKLLEKIEILAVSQIDKVSPDELKKIVKDLSPFAKKIVCFSSLSSKGLEELKDKIIKALGAKTPIKDIKNFIGPRPGK